MCNKKALGIAIIHLKKGKTNFTFFLIRKNLVSCHETIDVM